MAKNGYSGEVYYKIFTTKDKPMGIGFSRPLPQGMFWFVFSFRSEQ